MFLRKLLHLIGLLLIGGVLVHLLLVGPGKLRYEVPVRIRLDSLPGPPPSKLPPPPRERRIQILSLPQKGTPIPLVPDPASLRCEVQSLAPLRVLDPQGLRLVALHPLRRGLPSLLGISVDGFRQGDRLRLRLGKGEWVAVPLRTEGGGGSGRFSLPPLGGSSEVSLEWLGERDGRRGRVQRSFTLEPGPPPLFFAPSGLGGTPIFRALSQAGFRRGPGPRGVDFFVLPLDREPEPSLLRAVDAGMGVLLVPGEGAGVARGLRPLLPALPVEATQPRAAGKEPAPAPKAAPSKAPPQGSGGRPEGLSPKERPLPDKGPKKKAHSVAMVLLVDNSGSMEADGRIFLARKAALESALRLGKGDAFSLISFGLRPRTLLPIGPAFRTISLRRALKGLDASEGETRGYPAVIAAWKQLKRSPASIRHVVLLTDGLFQDIQRDFRKIFAAMKREGIGLTVIAVHTNALDAMNFLPLKRMVEDQGWTFILTRNSRRIPRLVLGEVETLRGADKKLVRKTARETPRKTMPKPPLPKTTPPEPKRPAPRLEVRDPHPLLSGLEKLSWPSPRRVLPFKPRAYALVPLVLQPGDLAFEAAGPYGLGRVLLIAGGLGEKDSLSQQSWFRKWIARSAGWLLNPDPPPRLRGHVLPGPGRVLEGEGIPRAFLEEVAARTGGKIVSRFSPPLESIHREREAPWWPWLLGCALAFLALILFLRP
ncbi:MAG TPA: VWA domain-containing protein [Planctomycetes bacterium]|nr:VWA domain-containing protein [Planctomycetota bacterium]